MFIHCCPFSSTESESNPNNNLMMRRAGLSRRKELTSWRFQVISGRMGMGGTSTMTWSPFPSKVKGLRQLIPNHFAFERSEIEEADQVDPCPDLLAPLSLPPKVLSGAFVRNNGPQFHTFRVGTGQLYWSDLSTWPDEGGRIFLQMWISYCSWPMCDFR